MLTAREWLLLPREEQEQRKDELSPYECFLLRTELEYMHFTEEEKKSFSQEWKDGFIHPKEYTEEEKLAFQKRAENIFDKLRQKAKKETTFEG